MAFSKQFCVTYLVLLLTWFNFTFALFYLFGSSFTISVETLLTFKMYWHVTNCFVLIVFPWSFISYISFSCPASSKALLLRLTFTFAPVTFWNFPFYQFLSASAYTLYKTSWSFNSPHIHMASQELRKPIKIKNVTLPRLELITFAIPTSIFMTSSPIV